MEKIEVEILAAVRALQSENMRLKCERDSLLNLLTYLEKTGRIRTLDVMVV